MFIRPERGYEIRSPNFLQCSHVSSLNVCKSLVCQIQQLQMPLESFYTGANSLLMNIAPRVKILIRRAEKRCLISLSLSPGPCERLMTAFWGGKRLPLKYSCSRVHFIHVRGNISRQEDGTGAAVGRN